MPSVYPFRPLQYHHGRGDVSTEIAPPYDVLDSRAKAELLAKGPSNIVAVDLPHTPASHLGPEHVYAQAAAVLRRWIANRTLSQCALPSMFAYRQTFQSAPGETIERCGMCCCVTTRPFRESEERHASASCSVTGARGAILPHEETFSGPKEDRFALMYATGTQLSPIFGLHADERGDASRLIRRVMDSAPADLHAELGGVRQEVWTITDDATIIAYQRALAAEDIFIADGHHRYNTQLNYINRLEADRGSPLPEDHPARRCMMVLVSMNDPGLVIWPTHRVFGGMNSYSIDRLLEASEGLLTLSPIQGELKKLHAELTSQQIIDRPLVALFDVQSQQSFMAAPTTSDPLCSRYGNKPIAWRQLDVAFVQHVLAEQICQPKLNAGEPIRWAFPHSIEEIQALLARTETGSGGGSGFEAQLVVLVRPTPLSAVREVSRAGELMPQKSTFFYPKLATGLWINQLHP